MNDLRSLVIDTYNKKESAMLSLTETFKPLISSLANTSGGRVEEGDLILHMFQTVNVFAGNIDNFKENGQIFNYIQKSIRYKNTQLSKKYAESRNMEIQLTENEPDPRREDDLCDKLYIDSLICRLTPLQRTVIYRRIICGIPDSEIAEELNTTRQSVNRIKNRALDKLRKFTFAR